MSRYASQTSVSVDRTESEIKKVLLHYGADDIVTGQSSASRRAFVQFMFRGMRMQVNIVMPDQSETRFTLSDSGKERNEDVARASWMQACRQQWRVLLLLIKANLEAIENGIMRPQDAFLPWLLLPDGRNVSEAVSNGLTQWLESGAQPKALPFGGRQ